MKIQQSFILIFSLFIILICIFPKIYLKESFENSSINLYKNSETEDEFYKKLYGSGENDFDNNLLTMDRCIKIPYNKTNRSMIYRFISNAKFPIIKKELNILNYKEIETSIVKELSNLYIKYNLKTFHGPVYVLLGQAPFLRVIDEDCNVRELVSQYTTQPENLQNLSKYINVNSAAKCSDELLNTVNKTPIKVHLYILFPTYNKSWKFVYRSWENIKCNMKDLLAQRSKDSSCFIHTMNNNNLLGGCMNQRKPYSSTCLGDNKVLDNLKYDYLNLYIINNTFINRYLNANLDSPFFGDSVNIQPYDNNDLEYCSTNLPITDLNKTIDQVKLQDAYKYKIINILSGKCLDDVPRIGTEKIFNCNKNAVNQQWVAESVPGKEGFYFKNSLTNRYLNVTYNDQLQKIMVNTIGKFSFSKIQRWIYSDYQIQLLDPLEKIFNNSPQYLYVIDNKLTLVIKSTILNNSTNLSLQNKLPGMIIGVGTDNQLYTKTSLTSPWIFVGKNTCCVKAIHIMNDGTILGVGTDNKLYTKKTLTANWIYVNDNTCCVIDIAQMADGMLLGIGTNNYIYIKKDLFSPWEFGGNNTCCITAIHVMNDNTILAVGTNGYLYTKATITSPWVFAGHNTCCVKDISQLPDGTIIGIGTNNYIYTKTSLSSNWVFGGYNTCCIKSITFLKNKADLIDTLSKSWQLEIITDTSNQQNITDIDSNIDNTKLKESIIQSFN